MASALYPAPYTDLCCLAPRYTRRPTHPHTHNHPYRRATPPCIAVSAHPAPTQDEDCRAGASSILVDALGRQRYRYAAPPHPACSLRDPNSSCVLTVAVALAEGSDPSWLRDRIPRSAVGATLIILYRVSDVDESAPPAAYSLPGARFGGGSTSALPPQAAAVARREPSRWQLHLISPLTE